ncbi:MAG: hypothetical protein HWD61_13560 [Parachlamydiaceae bacterium]|nr:MAG: hypothetical protein HWD61_13560 [Parachlamydiaceae bacterium]
MKKLRNFYGYFKNTTYSQRYDINHIIDVGFQNTIDVGCFKNHQQVTGVRGYHGRFENIIGWILENILHKAVSVKDQKGNKYYLNCNSLIKWADRVKKQGYVIDPNFSSFVRDSKLVQTALESIKEPTQKKKTFDNQEHPEKDHLKILHNRFKINP